MVRFVYASGFKTRAKAEAFLEDLFATGEVFASEHPKVEKRGGRFVITLDG